jgi:mannosyltransferase
MNDRKINLDGIIFSIQRYGGISVYFKELLMALENSAYSVNLLLDAPLMQSLDDIPGSTNVTHRRARNFERFRSCITSGKRGVYHSSYYRTPSSGLHMPTVVTVHDFIHEKFGRGLRSSAHSAQKRLAIRNAQAIICISETTKADLIELVGIRAGQAVHVIPNGVSAAFKPITKSNNTAVPYILFVGERKLYKNFRLAAQALAQLDGCELWAIGGGPQTADDLKDIDIATAQRVKFFGHVTEERLNQLYNDAHCLLYPSAYEGFGIPVIEAMKAGCPVVALDTPAVIETGGEALMVANAPDPGALAEAVNQLADNEIRKEIIASGLDRAQAYSWVRCHGQTIAVYDSLSAG